MLCFDEETGTRSKLGVLGVSPADPAQALSPDQDKGLGTCPRPPAGHGLGSHSPATEGVWSRTGLCGEGRGWASVQGLCVCGGKG